MRTAMNARALLRTTIAIASVQSACGNVTAPAGPHDDAGNAFRRFYGDAIADQLTQLLTDHILIAAQLVTAARAGDNDAVAARATHRDRGALRWQRCPDRSRS